MAFGRTRTSSNTQCWCAFARSWSDRQVLKLVSSMFRYHYAWLLFRNVFCCVMLGSSTTSSALISELTQFLD
jgi:hypothetical protein